jgi:hypothetical protein
VSLFESGLFDLHSGERSVFKIDCDFLRGEDWLTLAKLIVTRVPIYGSVEGVPSGGLKLASCLDKYRVAGSTGLLIVDDVLTTGNSMEAHRAGRLAYGAVVFARNECASWITPLFTLNTSLNAV